MVDENKWGWQYVVSEAIRNLNERGIKDIPQPAHRYRDLGEIEHIENTSDDALANWLIRYNAWYSYATAELSKSKAKLHTLEEMYDVILGDAMYKLSQTAEGRPVKDVLKALTIKEDKRVNAYYKKHVEQRHEVTLLEGTVKSLEIRCDALRSEFIRRASEKRVSG